MVGSLVTDVTLTRAGDNVLQEHRALRRHRRGLTPADRQPVSGRRSPTTTTGHVCRWEARRHTVPVVGGLGRTGQKLVATSSMTKLVCRDESSVAANLSVTLVPLYDVRSMDFCTHEDFGVDRLRSCAS